MWVRGAEVAELLVRVVLLIDSKGDETGDGGSGWGGSGGGSGR